MSKQSKALSYDRAICYSGFREGQRPGIRYPSYEQVREDLRIIEGHWKYLRLYDCDPHADLVIEVIQKEKMDFQLMLGAYIEAEVNNMGCPWGGVYSEEQLQKNIVGNLRKINKLIDYTNEYSDFVNCISIGNEASVDWTDHMVPVPHITEYAKLVKKATDKPLTFCENYVPWLTKLEPLAEVLDVISIHTYPVWEYKNISESLQYTKDNYYAVAQKYPDKQVIITEAGWATNSNGRGIDPHNVSEEFQKIYFDILMEWCDKEEVVTYFFEAFDELWKGSAEPLEPEKHWGIYKEDRTPKLAAEQFVRVKK